MYFFNCIAVSLYGPLQLAAVRACYVPGCPVHLSFDCAILLGFERNKWRDEDCGQRGSFAVFAVYLRFSAVLCGC